MMSSVMANGHIGMPHVMHHHPYDLEDNFLQILGKNLFFISVQAFALFVIANLINNGHSLLFRLSKFRRKKTFILVDCRKASVVRTFSISKTHENKFVFLFQSISVILFPSFFSSFLRCFFFEKAMCVFGFNIMIRGLTRAANIHK